MTGGQTGFKFPIFKFRSREPRHTVLLPDSVPLHMLFPLSLKLLQHPPALPLPCLLAIPTHLQPGSPREVVQAEPVLCAPFCLSQPGSYRSPQTSVKWVLHGFPSPVSPHLPKATLGWEGILEALHVEARNSFLPKPSEPQKAPRSEGSAEILMAAPHPSLKPMHACSVLLH